MLLTPSGDPLPRVITAELADQLGYPPGAVRSRIRTQQWQRLTRGLYLTRPDPPDRTDWIAGGLLIGGRGTVLSGWDAVRAHGLGAETPPTTDVLVLALSGRHRRVGPVIVRPSQRELRCVRKVLPRLGSRLVAGVARAVADTALLYGTFGPVRALVTSAVQRQMCTVEELVHEYETGPRNDSAHLHDAVDDIISGAESIAEAELLDVLRTGSLPTFEMNVWLVDDHGRQIAKADALWRTLGAVLEVNSRQHHFLEPDWIATMGRHNVLTRHGLSVVHYPPSAVRRTGQAVATQVRGWLRRRAAELGVPYPPPAPHPDLIGTPLRLPFVINSP